MAIINTKPIVNADLALLYYFGKSCICKVINTIDLGELSFTSGGYLTGDFTSTVGMKLGDDSSLLNFSTAYNFYSLYFSANFYIKDNNNNKIVYSKKFGDASYYSYLYHANSNNKTGSFKKTEHKISEKLGANSLFLNPGNYKCYLELIGLMRYEYTYPDGQPYLSTLSDLESAKFGGLTVYSQATLFNYSFNCTSTYQARYFGNGMLLAFDDKNYYSTFLNSSSLLISSFLSGGRGITFDSGKAYWELPGAYRMKLPIPILRFNFMPRGDDENANAFESIYFEFPTKQDKKQEFSIKYEGNAKPAKDEYNVNKGDGLFEKVHFRAKDDKIHNIIISDGNFLLKLGKKKETTNNDFLFELYFIGDAWKEIFSTTLFSINNTYISGSILSGDTAANSSGVREIGYDNTNACNYLRFLGNTDTNKVGLSGTVEVVV